MLEIVSGHGESICGTGPQWPELFPHLHQLGIEVILADDLPRFDEAVIDLMQHLQKKELPAPDEIKATLRKPFSERKRTWFTDAMDLMEWTDAMCKGAYPSREVPDPPYGPMSVVSIQLTAEELEAILTKTEIANTKKLRPQLEAMAAEGQAIELGIHDWSRVLLALCGAKTSPARGGKHLLRIATKIAKHLAHALEIDGPSLPG